jgi:acyl-CoA synthetase (NDP forming)
MAHAGLGLKGMVQTGAYTLADLKHLLDPASIAVVGASENPGPGLQVLENLKQLGYAGQVYPVNPRYRQVAGLPCFPSLTDLHGSGHRVEMVAILLNRNMVLPVVEEAGRIGARAAWAFASGFAEAGPDGKQLQDRLAATCRRHQMLFCGPNCVGVLNFTGRFGAYSAPAPREIKPGSIGMVAQSGYICIQVANACRGLGFSLILSAGNEAVVDCTDYIAYLLEDPATRVIMAFIEQFRRPELLPALAARARELGKPILLIKVGRSEMARRASVAHTGALAGADDIQDALFRKLGLIRADDLDELFETTELFDRLGSRLPGGDGVFAVTLSGGVIGLLGDLSEGLGLRYPPWSEAGAGRLRELLPPYTAITNPLDAWGFGRVEETYAACLSAAAEEPEADLLLVSQDVPAGMAPRQVDQYAHVARAAAQVFRSSAKPVVFLSNPSGGFHPEIRRILEDAAVPLLQGTREGLRAIHHLISYAAFHRTRPARSEPCGPSASAAAARGCFERPAGSLNEHDSKRVLAAYGIPCSRELLCRSAEEAVAAAEAIGGPVALKVVSAQIPHKSEAGVIALGLCGEREVRSAYGQLLRQAAAHAPQAIIEGVLCQQMITGAVAETIVGLLVDPQFGPAVLFGMGGVFVEALADRSLGIPPLDRQEALEMIEQTRAARLLKGFRGRPAADIEALIEVLIAVGKLGLDWADRIEALDINPLLLRPAGQGAAAVDALLIIKEAH